MKYIALLLVLSGCTRTACQLSVDNLVNTPDDITKIPANLYIELDDSTKKVSIGGAKHLENVAKLYPLVNDLKTSCSER